LPLAIIHGHFVRAAAARRSVGLDPTNHPRFGKTCRRHLLGVVHATYDKRLVGITFQEINNDLLADPGYSDRSVPFSSPGLRHSNPAGPVLVFLSFPGPMELPLLSTILIRIDFFSRRTYDYCSLATLHKWLWGNAQGAERRRERNALESIAITKLL